MVYDFYKGNEQLIALYRGIDVNTADNEVLSYTIPKDSELLFEKFAVYVDTKAMPYPLPDISNYKVYLKYGNDMLYPYNEEDYYFQDSAFAFIDWYHRGIKGVDICKVLKGDGFRKLKMFVSNTSGINLKCYPFIIGRLKG